MKEQQWLYLDGYDKVVTEDTNELVFDIKDLTCIELDNPNSTIDNVVILHNSGLGLERIEEYLLNNNRCSKKDRDYIIEQSFLNYFSKINLVY